MGNNFFKHSQSLICKQEDVSFLEFTKNSLELANSSNKEARDLLDYDLASEYGVLPISIIKVLGKNTLLVASTKKSNYELNARLRFITGLELKLIEVEKSVLEQAIFAAYKTDGVNLEEAAQKLKQEVSETKIEEVSFRDDNSAISGFLYKLIDYSMATSASDIHIIPYLEGTKIKLRINSKLLEHDQLLGNLSSHQKIINRIKILSGLDINEKQIPQEGAFIVKVANNNTQHIRSSIYPSVHGEKAVLRILGNENIYNLNDLGYLKQSYEFIRNLIRSPRGAIIFSGSTGSGKTTSMYSLINELKRKNLSIHSLEDPVEIQLEGISQSSIKPSIGFDYPDALKALMRQDPDIIMVGEIRDLETANIAIEACLTGHLLLTTIHSEDVFGVLLRLINFGIEANLLAQTLKILVHQSLLPKLCNDCKVIDLEASNHKGFDVYQANSCKKCDWLGYQGKVLVEEALFFDQKVKKSLINHGISELNLVLNKKNHISKELKMNYLLRNGEISYKQYIDYFS